MSVDMGKFFFESALGRPVKDEELPKLRQMLWETRDEAIETARKNLMKLQGRAKRLKK